MKKLRLVAALCLAVFCTPSGSEVLAQTAAVPASTPPAAQTAGEGVKRAKMDGELKLTREEEQLVRGSRAAVVATGLSERYFDEHFRLLQVVNSRAGRRVVWKFSLGEYETSLHDIIGFYTAGGLRTDTHSITGTLGATYEIRETIPITRAAKLMRKCIGRYEGAAVVYQRLSDDGKTGLYLTAQASTPTRRASGGAARDEREKEGARRGAQERGQGGATSGERVEPREEDEEGPPFFIGYVNLETGKCIRAQGIAR